jgi:hypothetical protein
MIYKRKTRTFFHPVSVYKDNNNGLEKILHKMFDSSEVSKSRLRLILQVLPDTLSQAGPLQWQV